MKILKKKLLDFEFFNYKEPKIQKQSLRGVLEKQPIDKDLF